MFENIIGQQHLAGKSGILTKMLKNNTLQSFILQGKSGIGKTTLANDFVNNSNYTVINLNGATSSKKEYQEVLNAYQNQDVIILIDEIHRLDKAKQNLLLPYMEKDNIKIVGTTTEDVHFSLLPPFLSRMLIFNMQDIDEKELLKYLKKLNKEKFKDNILSKEVLEKIIHQSSGDIRKINQYFNFIVNNYTNEEILNNPDVFSQIVVTNKYYHSDGDEHYNYLSAFQKSIRASDVNASLYYLAALLNFGDYEGVLRRLIVIAYEDIGLANPTLVYNVINVVNAFEKIGMPEGRLILGDYVTELALSPKSKMGYNAINKATKIVKEKHNLDVPKHIQIDQEQGYEYETIKTFYTNNLPREIEKEQFFIKSENTKHEKYLSDRYDYLNNLKKGEKGYDKR